MDPKTLHVRKGEPILPAWRRLQAWIRSTRVIAGAGVRLTQGPNGTLAIADTAVSVWSHPFRVSLAGASAFVADGSVNNLVPLLSGVGLDGVGDNGSTVQVPALALKVKASGRSWVCVRVEVTGGLIDPQSKTSLTIVEVAELPAKISEGGSPDAEGVGLHPLAVIYWQNGQPVRTHQVTHHNLIHRFVAAQPGRLSRHLFWAV